MRAGSRRVLLFSALAVVLTACPFPIPPIFPIPPFPGAEEAGIVVENTTEQDWVITVFADVPWSYAVPAGETGLAPLYGAVPSRISLSDRDCAEADTLAVDGALTAIRIDAGGSLVSVEPPATTDELAILLDYYECDVVGAAPAATGATVGAGGSLQIVGEDGSAWLLDPSTGVLAPVVAASSAEYTSEVAWSPDGTRLALARFTDTGEQGLYLAEVGADAVRLIAEDGGAPTWSPDGNRIAYVSYDPFAGGAALYVVDAEGGEPERLATAADRPAWSPDGTRIAYLTASQAADPLGAAESLRVINLDGGAPTTLAEAAPFGLPPRWSPDGRTIAYVGGDLMSPEVRLVSADGGEPQELEAPASGRIAEAAWSPDGTTLAVTWDPAGFFSGSSGIGLVDLGTGSLTRLATSDAGWYVFPTWSPDGAFVAAIRVGPAGAGSLILIGTADGVEVELATGVSAVAGWQAEAP